MAKTLEIVTVILFGLYFTTIEASPAQSPKIITDLTHCDSSLEDQNLPHESDCSKYYRCVYGKKVPKICPEKMLFNPQIGNCDLYYNVECPSEGKMYEDEVDYLQNLEEAIEHLTGKNFIKKKKNGNSNLDLDDPSILEERNTKSTDSTTAKFVYIPHENDPRAYYKIENGEKKLLYCEEGLVFSIDMEICARPWGIE